MVVAGIGSIGHPYQQYQKGEFARRALYAFRTMDGKLLWGGRRNYRKRPIIVGDKVFAEPHAWNLLTGETVQSKNPLTGETAPLNYLRGYSGCDHLLASASSLFGNANSGGFAHYNLDEQAGYVPLGGMALACNTGAVPANGVFVAPEGRSGCTCSFDIQTSVVLYPWPKSQTWGFGARGVEPQNMLPVKQVAVNLGAPGFRTDSEGQLWIPYAGQTNLAGAFGKWIPKYKHSSDLFSYLRPETDRITRHQQALGIQFRLPRRKGPGIRDARGRQRQVRGQAFFSPNSTTSGRATGCSTSRCKAKRCSRLST